MSAPDNAAVDLHEDDHVIGVWFVGFDADGPLHPSDVLATLWRKKGDVDLYHFVVRARWDAGTDDMTDDEKRTTHVTLRHDTDTTACDRADAFMRELVGSMPAPVAVPLEQIRVGGSVSKMIELMSDRPWCFISRCEGAN